MLAALILGQGGAVVTTGTQEKKIFEGEIQEMGQGLTMDTSMGLSG